MNEDDMREAERLLHAGDMKPEEFEKAFESAIHFAETLIGEKPDENIPHLFIHYRTIDENHKLSDVQFAVMAIAVDFESGKKQAEFIQGVGINCYKDEWIPIAIFWVAEALMNHGNKGDKVVLPYDDPTSTECAVAWGQHIMKDPVSCTVPLVRGKDGLFERGGPNVIARTGLRLGILRQFWLGYAMAVKAAGPPPEDEEGEEWKKG